MLTNVALFTSQDIGFQLVERLAAHAGLRLMVFAERTVRDDLNGYRSAIDACAARGIPCRQAPRVDSRIIEEVGRFNPALIVSAYYPHIIPASLLACAAGGGINIHPGLLPNYRGRYPTPWYILNGESQFGLAIHRIDSGIDTGDVFVQREYALPDTLTGHQLYRLTMDKAAELMAESLPGILSGSIVGTPQTGIGSYYSSIERTWRIDWNHSCASIQRRVRVHAKPYLPAHSQLFNRFVFINRARAVTVDGYTAQGGGRLIEVHPDGRFVVSCNDGCLLVEDFDVYPPLSDAERSDYFRVGRRFE